MGDFIVVNPIYNDYIADFKYWNLNRQSSLTEIITNDNTGNQFQGDQRPNKYLLWLFAQPYINVNIAVCHCPMTYAKDLPSLVGIGIKYKESIAQIDIILFDESMTWTAL